MVGWLSMRNILLRASVKKEVFHSVPDVPERPERHGTPQAAQFYRWGRFQAMK